MSGSRWLRSPARRAFDIVVAGGALVLASPIIAVAAVLVRLQLGSPVLFRQERAGIGGKPFEVVKFRTMSDDRDHRGDLMSDEHRTSEFGHWLRATSLDELPQLWTVVRGDMSLIGPRPLPTKYVERYSPEQRRRLEAIPGATGWAQVNGRNAISWPEKLALDVWYVDNASWWLDAKIVVLTVKAVLRRSNITPLGHGSMPEFKGET